MTKKHFQAFAALARDHRRNAQQWEAEGHADKAQQEYMVSLGIEAAVIRVATQDNPRFDEVRFRRACCLPEGKE